MGKVSKSTKVANTTTPKKSVKNMDNAPASQSCGPVSKELIAEHLPPIGLVFTVIACSGFLFMFSFRDVFATGRNIAGSHDEAMLLFTKSVDFFDDSNGWKSHQGGLSSIQQVTTDANNMGGLFVRKMGGAAGLTVQLQKFLPLLVHPLDARWQMGHFRPLFWTAVIANTMLTAFYATYMSDLVAAAADGLPLIFMSVMTLESLVILGYLFSSRNVKRGPAVALKDGKTPNSVVSRIAAKTVMLISGVAALIFGRDLFFPGEIIPLIPRDDIYLEWTGAFFHSPPPGSPEAEENGMTSALYVGEKFLSQLMALQFLIMCMYKFVSSCLIRYGSDGSGQPKARMIWKAQCMGNALILFLFRLFTGAATSASLDLRWHLMSFAYETFILGMYGFF